MRLYLLGQVWVPTQQRPSTNTTHQPLCLHHRHALRLSRPRCPVLGPLDFLTAPSSMLGRRYQATHASMTSRPGTSLGICAWKNVKTGTTKYKSTTTLFVPRASPLPAAAEPGRSMVTTHIPSFLSLA
ncbi:hypothetical protein PV10_06703 [Exophiala mesophila]|uniref:Uncharacterized protein n=1 Tax=Exophiala mesophila TaxID=212818 RepID=A0A0D1XVD6_EXOME|nr:uncharacterized protein PV10_06703 [Exophiala mesophila]KIV92246.1 hypothetical protein PV10_06703 [Exophiala mesophila]